MGGIDLNDGLVQLYKFHFQSNRWPMHIWHHIIHIAIVNAWLLYRRHCSQVGETAMSLKLFQMGVAEDLVKMNKRCGRPSFSEMLLPIRKKQCTSTGRVSSENVQYDLFDHFPIYKSQRIRCSVCVSKSIFTHFYCQKCHVYLCITKDKNCFYQFHHK